MECFKNRIDEVKKKEAFSLVFKRFLENLINWVHTAKVYTIFHVGLQDPATIDDIAAEIKERENLLYCYAKKPEEMDHRIFLICNYSLIVIIKHYELSQIYSTYIKKLALFISGCRVLELSQQKLKDFFKKSNVNDAFWIYSQLHDLIQYIINKVLNILLNFSYIKTQPFASNTEFTKIY